MTGHMTMATKLTVALALLVAGGALWTGASHAGESDAQACLDALVTNASAEGYRLRNTDSELLQPSESHGYSVVLTQGREYLIFACGDAATRDLDIYLFDENDELVYQDRGRDAQPIVTVTPEWTGTYLVAVKLYEADSAAAFAMAVMYK